MVKERTYSESELADMIYERGLRPSAQRISVLSFIANSRMHPTADEIYTGLSERFPSLSRTTVYNSLHYLARNGLARELEIESGNRRYDLAAKAPHAHFICRRCGAIHDVWLPDSFDGHRISPGFRIENIEIYYKGVCPECAAKDSGPHLPETDN